MSTDPRDVEVTKVGGSLRDAAVDPRPGDRPVFPVRKDADGTPRRLPPEGVEVDDRGVVVEGE